MASVAYYSLFILSFCVFTLFNLNPAVSTQFDEYFFILGDGLYDPGNGKLVDPEGFYPSYYPPYGTTFFKHPTGRFSDGRIVADFIAEKAKFPEFIPSINRTEENMFYGGNSAFIGAHVIRREQRVFDFDDQIQYFNIFVLEWYFALNRNITETLRRLNKATYLVSIGADDYLNSNITSDSNTEDLEKLVDRVLDTMSSRIKVLCHNGARKFVVQNVAPLGLIPFVKQTRDNGTRVKLTELAAIHRHKLPKILKDIQDGDQCPGFKFTVFDYYAAMTNMIRAPQKYGFKYGNIACCGNSTFRGQACGSLDYEFSVCDNKTEYIYFDGTHNTDAANKLLAELMWCKKSGYISPYGVKDFFESKSIFPTSAAY